MLRRRSAAPALGAILLATTSAGAQVASDTPKASVPEVALDQLSTTRAGASADASRAGDLDIPQPPPLPRAATVTSSEVSSRADSRALAVAPVVGTDRCDAAAPRDRSDFCRHRLEARMDHPERPAAAPITAEGRLLLLVSPNGMGTPTDRASRQLGAASGLNAPNGPAEQLAGALQDRKPAQDAASTAASAKGTDQSALPSNVPTIAVLPAK